MYAIWKSRLQSGNCCNSKSTAETDDDPPLLIHAKSETKSPLRCCKRGGLVFLMGDSAVRG